MAPETIYADSEEEESDIASMLGLCEFCISARGRSWVGTRPMLYEPASMGIQCMYCFGNLSVIMFE
jgi:hypothetical protein